VSKAYASETLRPQRSCKGEGIDVPSLHATFQALLDTDGEFASEWRKVIKVDAAQPHMLQHVGVTDPLTEEVQQHVENLMCKVYKLNPESPCRTVWLAQTSVSSSTDVSIRSRGHRA